jgi:dGTPase
LTGFIYFMPNTAMNWTQLLNAQRLGAPQQPIVPINAARSDFHKDHDRIVFSSPFRRLGRKTQVHPLTANDHVHTRLTHSIEVGSVGRSLGIMVGQLIQHSLPVHITPYDLGAIVQAACLAHDIGNPPFGHAGEYAIRDWFRREEHAYLLQNLSAKERQDIQTFEGNAQGFRVVTQLENHRFKGGMRLTFATLGTLLKYPWTSEYATEQGKFGCYQAEKSQLNKVAQTLGLLKIGPDKWVRHPLSYLMEAADDICYTVMDLEDGFEIGMLTYDMVETTLIRICGDSELLRMDVAAAPSARRKISLLRSKAINRCVHEAAATFAKHHLKFMDGVMQQDLLLLCPAYLRKGINAAKEMTRKHIFSARRKVEIEVGSFTCLDILLNAFFNAAYQLKTASRLSFRNQRILDLMEYDEPEKGWPLYQSYMRVMDFIGGMTDNYATYLAQQIGGMGR